MSYAINIAAAVAAALIAGLCAAGVLEGSALLMVLCAVVLLVYLCCKGFGKNTCDTGPVIVGVFLAIYLLWGVPTRWDIGALFSALRSVIGSCILAWAADDNWLLSLISLAVIILLWLVQRKVELAAFSVLRYCGLTVLLTQAAEQVFSSELTASLTDAEWKLLLYPIVLLAAMSLSAVLRKPGRKLMWKTFFAGFAYLCLLPVLDALWADTGVVASRICTLMRLEGVTMLAMLVLALITLAGQSPKNQIPLAYRRAAILGLWLVYMLLLRWRCSAMALDMQGCWPVSALGLLLARALYYRDGVKRTAKQQICHGLLTVAAMLTMSLAILQTRASGWRVYLLAGGLWLLGWLCAKIGAIWNGEIVARDCYLGAAAMTMLYVVRSGGVMEIAGWVAAGMIAALWCGVLLGLNRAEKLSAKSGIWPEEYHRLRRACALLPLIPALLCAGYILF